MTAYRLVAALVLVPSLAIGAPPEDRAATDKATPEKIAQKALTALKENRLDDFVNLMHPEALKKFKKMIVPLAEAAAEEGEGKEILTLFTGVSDTDELKKLSNRKFFLAFYRGIVTKLPEMRQLLQGAEFETIGHVIEGKDRAHVVCRLTMSLQGVKFTKMNVLSLKRTDGGWAMLLSGEVEGMANVLKKQYGSEK